MSVPRETIIHMSPSPGSNVLPCCGRTPFLVRLDRMTVDSELVTCSRATSSRFEEMVEKAAEGMYENARRTPCDSPAWSDLRDPDAADWWRARARAALTEAGVEDLLAKVEIISKSLDSSDATVRGLRVHVVRLDAKNDDLRAEVERLRLEANDAAEQLRWAIDKRVEALTEADSLRAGLKVARGKRAKRTSERDAARAEINRMRRYEQGYQDLQQTLASPPDGWFVLGTHVDSCVALEFWGSDGGIPIWERPSVSSAVTRAHTRHFFTCDVTTGLHFCATCGIESSVWLNGILPNTQPAADAAIPQPE